jgi:hypothetical protein
MSPDMSKSFPVPETSAEKSPQSGDEGRLPYPEDEPLLAVWPTIARALGIGRSTAFRMIEDGTFPIDTLTYGARYYGRTADVRSYLRLPLTRPA